MFVISNCARLNELLTISAKYATYHDSVFNKHKSVCLYFKPMHFKIKHVNSIYLNGVKINIDSHCKYLGHIVSDDLSHNRDINKQLRSLYSRSNMLLQTFGACLPNEHLFMTYCGSMYTIQLWCRYTKKQYKKIIVAYNNVFANSLDIIEILVQVVCLLRAEWILLMYMLTEWCIVSEKESTTLKTI